MKIQNTIYLFLIVFLSILVTNTSAEVDKEFIVTAEGLSEIFEIEKDILCKITGEANKSKKYILIKLGYLSEGKSPNLFVSKKLDISESEEYDYTSIQDSKDNIKLVIPSDYLDLNGFYLKIQSKGTYGDINLSIEYIDVLSLSLGEKFSFFSKEKEVESFEINVTDLAESSNSSLISYIIYGNDEQIKMQIGNKLARKKLPNVLSYEEQNPQRVRNVKIKVPKNNKFTFLTQIISTDSKAKVEQRETYEGEYNQFFMVTGNREECFSVNSINDDDYDTERDVIIIGQKGFDMTVTCREKEILKQSISPVPDEEAYVSSPPLTCVGQVEKICIKSKQEKQSIIRISIDKKIYSKGIYDVKRKMPEPLLKSIYQPFEMQISSENELNAINFHSYDTFFERDEANYGIKGVDIDIEVKYGKIFVYRYLCKTYPYCGLNIDEYQKYVKEEGSNSDFEKLYNINGHVGTTIFSANDTYSLSNQRNIILVHCDAKQGQKCSYRIAYHSIQESKKLFSGSSMLKYLGYSKLIHSKTVEDSYSIFLHKDKKIIIDLVVYSGDAFIIESKNDDVSCRLETVKFGSNERKIYKCDPEFEIMSYHKLDFKVQANKEGATYYINVQEKDIDSISNDEFDIQTTITESIKYDPVNFTLKSVGFTDQNEKQYSTIYTIFHPLTCNLQIINEMTNEKISTEDQEITIDSFKLNSSNKDYNYIKYNIQQIDSSHGQNQNCLYSVSSAYLNENSSLLVLPEAKPFRIKIKNGIKRIAVVFPYASTHLDPIVYLRVTMFKNYPVALSIQVGFAEPKTMIISHSKDILIATKDTPGLRYNKIVPIEIIVSYLTDEENENTIDFNIRTLSQIPYTIKSEEHFSDLVINNRIQYYVSVISENSRGNVLLNFKRGTGLVFGRLLSVDHNKETGGWNDRIILPNENSKDLLKFDFYDQKLIINKEDTEKCNQFCYLVFGVKQREESNTDKDISSSYSLFFRYFDEDEVKGNYITLQNDEFIYGGIRNNQNDYYKYKIQHDSMLLIDFKSEYCKLTLAFGTEDFKDTKRTKIYKSYDETLLIKISKDELLSFYKIDQPEISSTENQMISIKVDFSFNDTKADLNKLDTKYKLRVNSPLYVFDKITTVDTSQPTFCDNTMKLRDGFYYCDYLVNLDNFDNFKSIELVGVSSGNNNLEIFANVIDPSEISKGLLKYKLPEWPSKKKHDFPTSKHPPQNLLKIKIDEFPQLTNNDRPKLLVRVYSSGNSSIELLTNLVGYQKFLSPLPKYYQLFSADQDNGIVFNLPTSYSYNIHFICLYGKGNLNYGGKQYSIFGDFASVVIKTNKHEKQEFKILGEYYDLEYDYDSNFRFYVWYTKNTNERSIEQLSLGSGGDFIYRKINVPFIYYMKINDNKSTIPFNIILKKLQTDQEVIAPRDKNATELFDIKGYLMTSDQFIQLQIDGDYSILGNPIQGNYDYSHHQGNVFFETKDIDQFMKNNQLSFPIYGFIIVESSKDNERTYNYMHNCISVFPPNDLTKSTPSEIYLTNHFKAHKNLEKHVYKLNGLSTQDEEYRKMYFEFATIDKNVKIKFVDDPNNSSPTKNMTDFFGIYPSSSRDNYGVDVFVLTAHLNLTHLVIESPSTSHDVEYSFRYRSTIKSLSKYEFKTNVTYKLFNNNKVKLNISKVLWDEPDIVADCNYYIRIFKYSGVRGDLPISTSFREQTPYAVYKVSSNDSLLKNKEERYFIYEMITDLEKDYYIDILGEVLDFDDAYEFVAYRRFFPEEEYTEENKGAFYIVLIILIVLLVLVIAFVIVFLLYKKKNEDLQKKVEEVSFKLSKSEEANDGLTSGVENEENNEKNALN